MKSTPKTQTKAVCYYDGKCPLCKIEVNAMKKQDIINAIRWVDISENQQALDNADISYQQAMERIHVINEQQQIVTGVRGFLAVWQHLPYYQRLVPVVRWTPILMLMEVLYSLFARYRLALTGRSHENIRKKKVEEGAK